MLLCLFAPLSYTGGARKICAHCAHLCPLCCGGGQHALWPIWALQCVGCRYMVRLACCSALYGASHVLLCAAICAAVCHCMYCCVPQYVLLCASTRVAMCRYMYCSVSIMRTVDPFEVGSAACCTAAQKCRARTLHVAHIVPGVNCVQCHLHVRWGLLGKGLRFYWLVCFFVRSGFHDLMHLNDRMTKSTSIGML
eukprot:1137015-Pelagomonas_calceolata.AAC.6